MNKGQAPKGRGSCPKNSRKRKELPTTQPSVSDSLLRRLNVSNKSVLRNDAQLQSSFDRSLLSYRHDIPSIVLQCRLRLTLWSLKGTFGEPGADTCYKFENVIKIIRKSYTGSRVDHDIPESLILKGEVETMIHNALAQYGTHEKANRRFLAETPSYILGQRLIRYNPADVLVWLNFYQKEYTK